MRPHDLLPGTVVSVYVPIMTWHPGIVTETRLADGPTVVHNSKYVRRVTESTWTDFVTLQGRRLKIRIEGLPRVLPPGVVIARARSRMDEPWDLFGNNCEHFVTWAHGMPRRSPQMENWVAAGGLGLLLSKLWR